MPFNVVRSATQSPSSRPALPRASSNTSGLRFCGMRLEPVLKASDSVTKAYSPLAYVISSTPRRERCVPISAIANSTSATKSRSPVASSALAEIARKPSASFSSTRSTGKPEPASAPDPSGISDVRRRALAVRVAGQDCVEPAFRFGNERATQCGDRGVQLVDRAQRPEAQVRGDLVVAGAARVQLSGDRADLGVEQALDEGVHVFIRRADRGAVGELVGDAIETADELRFFTGSHDAGVTERVHPRLARGDILRPEPMIDGKAAV